MPDALADLLAQGGDRRSIGRSTELVADILRAPELFGELIAAMLHHDPLVRMRAADVAEKVTRTQPGLLAPYTQRLLRDIAEVPQHEVRWHVAQMLPRLPLSPAERQWAVRRLFEYLDDRSVIVRVCAMQALADLALDDETLRARLLPIIRRLTSTGPPAVRARGRKLMAILVEG
jgi:hypothetical protein